MALLRGFQKTKAGSGEDTTPKMLTLLEKSYLNKTAGGEFNTIEDVQGMIDQLKKLPQGNVDVQTKIAELENKKLQFGVKLDDMNSQKNVFETQLQAVLDESAKNNFKDVRGLIGSYAKIYADADASYDQDVTAKILQRYGTLGTIPQDVLDYRKTLNEKAKFLAGLSNSYNVVDPATGEVGMLNPEGVAVKMDTNPTNGAVQHIDIVPSSQIDDKSYMRTEFGLNVVGDRPNKKLPTYLRVNDVGVSSDGKTIRGSMLGNVSYQEKMNTSDTGAISSGGVLTPTREKVGFFDKLNFLSSTPAEKLNGSIDSMKVNGINFSSDAYKYDSQAVPNDAVLQMGSRVFYSTGKDGQILEITGKNREERQSNFEKYMKGIGKDPNMIPYKITKDYLTLPDGNPRVAGKVDANYFAAQSAPQQTPQGVGAPVGATNPAQLTAFFGNKNTPNKPAEPVVGNSTPDLVAQGASFFRNAQTTPPTTFK